jgi:uncharacterized protein involved in exopolysaccharide biosynthesis
VTQPVLQPTAVEETTPLRVANFALRHRRLLVGLPAIGFLLPVLLHVVIGVGVTSRSRFAPQARDAAGGRLAALAAQFSGFTGAMPSAGESVEFYAELLRSRDLLRQAVLTDYTVARRSDTLRGNLVTLLDVGGKDPERRIEATMDRLSDQVGVRTSRDANLVDLTVTMPWRSLAIQVNNRILELVNEFNLEKRRSRAAAERQFAEARQQDARRSLDSAENELRRFLESNRQFESPQLKFEEARLQRRVDLRQQVYLSLAQAYEQARIDEVRDTPVITVMDRPEYSVRPSRGTLVDALVWAFLAGLVALALAGWQEYMARERFADQRAFGEFQELRRQLRPPWVRRRAHSSS